MSQPEERTVDVAGGSITLVVDVEWLTLTDEDFRFIRSLVAAMDRIKAPAAAAPAEAEEPVVDDGAPMDCATCGVALGSWPAAVEHGRIGCKTFDTGEVPCPDCGRKFVNKAGLGVHRARAHKPGAPGSLIDRLLVDELEARVVGPAAFEHVLAEKRRAGYQHIATCSCGFATRPCDYPGDAVESLRAHIEAETKTAAA